MNKTIVLMPVKNEDWILPLTLDAAEQIADHILVSDQNSTDKTPEILAAHPKVDVIQNSRSGHSNEVRWDLLDEARKRYGANNLLLNIDADELLPPIHFLGLKTKIIEHVAPGKVWVSSPWIQIWRSVNTFRNDNSVWSPVTNKKPFAIIDDGKADYSRQFVINDHTSRVPGPEGTPVMETNVPLLHFQFVNWQRTQEKQAWYRCRELISGGDAAAINQKYQITKDESGIQYSLVPKKWYKNLSVPSTLETQETPSWYVKEIEAMIEEHGEEFFRELDIGDVLKK